jgi:PAS domain S-box-containing protein
MSLLDWLLNPSGLTAHGFCLSWAPGLIALHAGSDAVVGASYFSIPLALAAFMRQRHDLRYRSVFWAFIAFILACGTSHFFSILTLWVPAYGVEGVFKLLTAALSVATAAMLWPLIPRLVALPSPQQLARLNRELSVQVAEQERTAALLRDSEARMRSVNAELERRVANRTADLRATNALLTETLWQRDNALGALAHSEAQFRASFEAAAVGMVLFVPETRTILQVNRSFAAMVGYASEELVGQVGIEMVHPEDRDRQGYACLMTGHCASHVREARYLRRDGTMLWARISNAIARDPQSGQPIVGVALAEDIDARYRAEADLRAANAQLTETLSERDRALLRLARSEAEFRAAFDVAAVGILLTDPQSIRIVRINRAFAGMLGYEPEELIGRAGSDVVFAEDREQLLQARAHLPSGEYPTYVRQARCARRDGTPFWTRISSSTVHDPQTGTPALRVSIVEDIDAQHRAESALRAAKADLERLVDERTAALKQRDLLLREVYHRVKNNLQIVDGLLTMQARQLDDPQAKRALLGLRGRVYALGLVHQQLMGSADLKTFDVAPFLQELSRNILEGGDDRGVEVAIDACPLRVGLDFAIPLGLLVTELVTNSLKHAFPDRAGSISVRLQPGADGDVVLEVADDGQPQARSNGVGPPGPGLGMRIIKGLVDQLAGKMSVRHDGGTCTEIRTPMPVQP